MSARRRQSREKDFTGRYLRGDLDEDQVEAQERFSRRSSEAEQRRIERTALLRAAEEEFEADLESLPVGQVVQVYSLYCDVEHNGVQWLCVTRKTLARLSETAIVVGDFVRFRSIGVQDEQGRPEGVIEQALPRRTILTRSDSFKAIEQHPIVANAEQMLIVVSLHEPEVRWGLVDRMIIAAQAGGLRPIVCLNKIDLRSESPGGDESYALALEVLAHYQSLGIGALQTSVPQRVGVDELRGLLRDTTTVLAGHSGAGKSTLINAVEPSLNLRTGAISGYTGKGRHTTTSARRYPLERGHVIDTPGVKLFGLWGVTRENLLGYFPDIEAATAPQWRRESFERILESLPEEAGAAGERR